MAEPRSTSWLMITRLVLFLTSVGLASADGGWRTSGSAWADASEKRVFQIQIRQREVVGVDNVIRITQGETVALHWTTDEQLSIHLHGYNLETTLIPGGSAVMQFRAYATGRFPVTMHGSDHHAQDRGQAFRKGKAEKSLLYIEVHPR